jgi:hypothetical protein
MPRYRITVRKTEVSHRVVEIVAHTAFSAAQKGTRYVDGVYGARRGVTVVQTYDEDTRATELLEVIAVKEA